MFVLGKESRGEFEVFECVIGGVHRSQTQSQPRDSSTRALQLRARRAVFSKRSLGKRPHYYPSGSCFSCTILLGRRALAHPTASKSKITSKSTNTVRGFHGDATSPDLSRSNGRRVA